jgi:hypothetical protein
MVGHLAFVLIIELKLGYVNQHLGPPSECRMLL